MAMPADESKGHWGRMVRRYMDMNPEQQKFHRDLCRRSISETFPMCVEYAQRFLAEPDSLTHADRKAGADAFERWRAAVRDLDCVEEAMACMSTANVVPLFPSVRPQP